MQNELMHYGKKGMRWGVRRDRKNQTYNFKRPKKLSDEELNRNLNRLRKENEYKQLLKQRKPQTLKTTSNAASKLASAVFQKGVIDPIVDQLSKPLSSASKKTLAIGQEILISAMKG